MIDNSLIPIEEVKKLEPKASCDDDLFDDLFGNIGILEVEDKKNKSEIIGDLTDKERNYIMSNHGINIHDEIIDKNLEEEITTEILELRKKDVTMTNADIVN